MNKIKSQVDIVYNDKTQKDITIFHLSDLHFNINTKDKQLNKIKEFINHNNLDYIMITGDLLDDVSIIKNKDKINKLLIFLTDIAKRCKVLISLGNHDILTNNDYHFFNKLNDLKNIYILNNDTYQDSFIYVSGFTLPNNYYYNISGHESLEVLQEYLNNNRQLITKLPKDKINIALIHSPIFLMEKEVLKLLKEYDLLLSGHMHNGMIPDILNKVFKNNYGIIAPDKSLFPNVARGKITSNYANKQITLIISSGITKLSLSSTIILSKLNFLYNIGINKIIIRKKRGNYEKN